MVRFHYLSLWQVQQGHELSAQPCELHSIPTFMNVRKTISGGNLHLFMGAVQ